MNKRISMLSTISTSVVRCQYATPHNANARQTKRKPALRLVRAPAGRSRCLRLRHRRLPVRTDGGAHVSDIKLGMVARDRVNGDTGLVTGMAEYLYASPSAQITDQTAVNSSRWVDLARLEPAPEHSPMGLTGERH